MTNEYRSTHGPIPDEAFENDMGAPDPERYDRMMSKEARAKQDATFAATLARVKRLKESAEK